MIREKQALEKICQAGWLAGWQAGRPQQGTHLLGDRLETLVQATVRGTEVDGKPHLKTLGLVFDGPAGD
jgi:hypothetical protein